MTKISQFMRSVAQAVQDQVQSSPLLISGLSRDVLNLSAVARDLRPGLEKQLYKNITSNAIQLALQRFSEELAHKTKHTKVTIERSEVISDVVVFFSPKRASVLKAVAQASQRIHDLAATYLDIITEEKRIVIAVSRHLEPALRDALPAGDTLHVRVDYHKVAVKLTLGDTPLTDALAVITHLLQWHGVTIDGLSTQSQALTIITDQKNVARLLNALGLLIEQGRDATVL
ncbi:MAG TPA: hypothetical protein VM124_03425 [Candidatus Limnocylindrales bacterium]|nr:hypothetical protein [Candidatus Limnocylindrales bacterium]